MIDRSFYVNPVTKSQIFATHLENAGLPPEDATQVAVILANGEVIATPEQMQLLERSLAKLRRLYPGQFDSPAQ